MRHTLVFASLFGCLATLGACVDHQPTEVPAAEMDGGSVLLTEAGILETSDDLRVFGVGDSLLVDASYAGSVRSAVQLEGLPADWVWIGFYRRSFQEAAPPVLVGRVVRATGLAPSPGPPVAPPEGPKLLLALLLVLVAVYAVWVTGISGGPNHGEHPLVINIAILVVFGFASPEWPSPFGGVFMALVTSAVVLAVPVMGIRVWDQPKITFAARAAYVLLYSGMLAVMMWPKSATVSAQWTAPSTLEVHASTSMTGLSLVAGDGDIVHSVAAVSRHVLVFISGEPAPDSAEVEFLGGGTAVVEVSPLPDDER